MAESLRFNERTKEFVLVSNDQDRAEEAGLTLSTSTKGPDGELVWFTDVGYAALGFWDMADARAKTALSSLKRDFEASRARESNFDPPVPRGFELFQYQRAGIHYAASRPHALIGDGMGLGKTAEAIVLANYFGYEKVLIVCPGSIRLNWRREVIRWSTLRRKTTYPILRSADGVNPYANFVIVSYDLLRNPGIHAALMRMRWDMVILDEAHYLKSMSAKRAQAVFGGGLGQFKMNGIVQNAERVIALTGTPLPNRPRECYSLSRALHWESIDWASYDSFCYRFNPSAQMKTKHVLEMKGRLPELQARLRCNFMVRRLKEDVLKELPDKRYELAYLEKTGPIKKVLQKEKLIDFTLEDLENPFSEIWGQVSTVRREMGEAKAPQVVHHVKHLLDTVEVPKLVMFSYHKSVMDYLKKELSRYGVVEVRGGISTERKQQAVDAFVNDPDCRIFSGQLIAAGTGIDGLQKVCELALITEPDWVPGNNDQAIDRLHRIGQHGNVIAQFAVVEGSLDERVLSSMFGKTQTIHASLDGGY